MVDPLWNKESENDASYKDVLVDVYAPEQVYLKWMDDYAGMDILIKTLKNVAQTKIPQDEREFYLGDNEDYGDMVYRVSDVEASECWYGFIYTNNQSPYRLKEIITPQLKGLEVIYPPNCKENVKLDIPAG